MATPEDSKRRSEWTGSVKGYIIAQEDWDDEVKITMGRSTFSFTAGEAWVRHVGFCSPAIDRATIIQRWHDKGYRPIPVTMIIGHDALRTLDKRLEKPGKGE